MKTKDHVDDEVGHHHEEGGVDHRGKDHRQIEGLQRVIGQLADALQSEHHFGQQRTAADERTEIEAEHGDEGDQRCPQTMMQQHPALAYALGTGGADEILLHHFDQACPQHAAVEADIERREREPGDYQRLEPAPGILGQRDVAERRNPGKQPGVVQAALRQQIGDLAQPEHRNRTRRPG